MFGSRVGFSGTAVGGSNGAHSGSIESKMAASGYFETIQTAISLKRII